MIGASTDGRDQVGHEKPPADSEQREHHAQHHERDNEHGITTAARSTAETNETIGTSNNARGQLGHEDLPKRTPGRKHPLNQNHEPTAATRGAPIPRIPPESADDADRGEVRPTARHLTRRPVDPIEDAAAGATLTSWK